MKPTESERHTLYFKEYNIIRNDRPNGKVGGGTAILIKNNIKHEILDINTETELIESTAISLDTTNNNKLILVSIYAKKGATSKFKSDLEKLFNKLNLISQTNYYVIAGDFNAKHVNWSNKMNDERGISLQDWLNNNDIRYRINLLHSSTPSYPRNESYIDLLISDARLEYIMKIAINYLPSKSLVTT